MKTFRINLQSDIKKTNIYFGNFELMESNSILYYDSDSPIELEMVFSNQLSITIKFVVEKNDSEKTDLKIDVDTEKNIIVYKCVNFNNPLGTGTTKPVEIGKIGGKNIFVHFWLYAMGKDSVSRKIEYSIWKEK